MARTQWQRNIDRLRGGGPIEDDLTAYESTLRSIEEAGRRFAVMSDADLKQHAKRLKSEVAREGTTQSAVIEGFALVREAADRVLGMRPFDVQVLAGLALHRGKLVEMKTGEGKTLVAVLPACLEGMTGKGVHILTFNDYLAQRDAAWMGPVYSFMGLSVGSVREGMSAGERRAAYRADITYSTAKEAGFDFLRMHLCRSTEEIAHRPFHFAIIDEADSILIDEARVPLVIAGERLSSDADPYRIAEIVKDLSAGEHWETDENRRNVLLTETGIDRIEAVLRCGDLHADENLLLLTEVNQALHARVLLQKDVDYIVRDGGIELVDEFTGRVVDDRRWPDGLQAAIEAKEGVAIQPGGRVLGSITLNHFLRQYPKLAGMTATAQDAAEELVDFYGLPVAPVPPNRPCIREDRPAVVFTHKAARYAALVEEVRVNHRKGRPVLVGTGSVRESEIISLLLDQAGIGCNVLNAKNDHLEAEIIANAGALGAVTISTNMAGRGTDIRLGGKDEADRDAVVALGGLYVIGTTMHESRRIDDQLRGRAGRQGDPGSSVFFVSLEDDLIRRFGIDELIPAAFWPEPQADPVENPFIRKEVARIQRIVEGQNYEIRKTLRRYSELVEKQRKQLQDWRMGLLKRREEPSFCREAASAHYAMLVGAFGEDAVAETVRQIAIHHVDACWAEHLAHVSELREGIHLVGIGGLNPLHEFNKHIVALFATLQDEIEQRTLDAFMQIDPSERALGRHRAGIKGPSSTWTYLINDRVMSDLQNMLFGQGSSAFAAGAVVMMWPVLLVWGIWQRWKRRG